MADPSHAREAPLSPSLRGLRAVGLLALVGLVALVAALPRLVPVDDWLWRTVLLLRGCTTDAIVDRVVDTATGLLTALLVVATVLHVRKQGVGLAWPWVATVVLGLFTSKTLKHLLTRERPSSLPDVALGYSFPSAHVMNSLAAAIAVVVLAQGFRRRNLWSIGVGLLVTTVTVGRVLLGRHWACDVAGGGLAALALIGVLVPAIIRRPLRAPAIFAVGLAVAFGFDAWMAQGGLRLPSPLIGTARALVDVDVGAALRPTLVGAWREAAEEQVVATFVWLEGSGTVPFDLPSASAVSDARRPLHIAVGGRTEKVLPACMTLAITLNDRLLARFVPFSGWREYRLPVPAGLLRPGRNALTVTAKSGADPARFAVTYVRVGDARLHGGADEE